jgi:membrane fusion protein (multidrug efflux system)
MVIGADNKPVSRTVKIASQQGESWIVIDGLKEGENVMVDGFQKLQMLPPGTPVKPVPWTPAGTQAPAQAGAPAAQPNAAGAQAAAGANASGARTPSSGSPAAGATTPANSSR